MIGWKVTHVNRQSVHAQGKYKLTFEKDTVVKAIQGTLGIMLFEEYLDAQSWALRQSCFCYRGHSVLQVELLGEITKPVFISMNFEEVGLNIFYRECSNPNYSTGFVAPAGAICSQSVRVLN